MRNLGQSSVDLLTGVGNGFWKKREMDRESKKSRIFDILISFFGFFLVSRVEGFEGRLIGRCVCGEIEAHGDRYDNLKMI